MMTMVVIQKAWCSIASVFVYGHMCWCDPIMMMMGKCGKMYNETFDRYDVIWRIGILFPRRYRCTIRQSVFIQVCVLFVCEKVMMMLNCGFSLCNKFSTHQSSIMGNIRGVAPGARKPQKMGILNNELQTHIVRYPIKHWSPPSLPDLYTCDNCLYRTHSRARCYYLACMRSRDICLYYLRETTNFGCLVHANVWRLWPGQRWDERPLIALRALQSRTANNEYMCVQTPSQNAHTQKRTARTRKI